MGLLPSVLVHSVGEDRTTKKEVSYSSYRVKEGESKTVVYLEMTSNVNVLYTTGDRSHVTPNHSGYLTGEEPN